jgi:hypothetical protein
MAWDEWKKNSLARHAATYPDVWYGIWSGTDSYNSTVDKTAGETVNNPYFHGTDFPVLNLHSHACSLYSSSKAIGLEFNESGLTVRPELPVESYRFESELVGVIKLAEGSYEGWYAPLRAGTWTVKVGLPQQAMSRLNGASVNGAAVELKKDSDGLVTLTGASGAGKPLRWRIH